MGSSFCDCLLQMPQSVNEMMQFVFEVISSFFQISLQFVFSEPLSDSVKDSTEWIGVWYERLHEYLMHLTWLLTPGLTIIFGFLLYFLLQLLLLLLDIITDFLHMVQLCLHSVHLAGQDVLLGLESSDPLAQLLELILKL